MADAREAVKIATDYIKEVFGDPNDLRLEEIEPSDSGGWYLTLSYIQDYPFGARAYKQVELNRIGQPIAVRIRKV